MNGAEALVRTLIASGVDTCFMNPGTTEIHLVDALDRVPEMRGVLALFEGVATGAADGYGRMRGRPAATLLHLGPGLGNGLANLHNARRARSPVVNIVGDHATSHERHDAPLQSDIDTVARNVSRFVRRSTRPEDVGADARAAVTAALGPPGQVATLVVPADVSWSAGGAVAAPASPAAPAASDPARVEAIAAALRSGQPCVMLIGGRACRGEALVLAAAIASVTKAKILCETFPARLERGAGRPPVDRLAYFGDTALGQMGPARHVVLVDAPAPASFFAYPGAPSLLVPAGCATHALCSPEGDPLEALRMLADAVGARAADAPRQEASRPALPAGRLGTDAANTALAALMPEGAIVVDEGNTSTVFAAGRTAGAPPHDWLCLSGGSIGFGLPAAVGAAIACPDRKVVVLESDGSAMYSLQAWWTMARAGLDVTTLLLTNRSYAVLNMELGRAVAGEGGGGPRAREMLDLSRPDIDFVSLARGMGLQASRSTTADELVDQLGRALATTGPSVIELVLA
ncbi:MAG TPA: acetolactate synthase large subunit [Kofleriaceae bacterium]|nr:acetolactate synthase large subunit [Kofleriaceae bacterium]